MPPVNTTRTNRDVFNLAWPIGMNAILQQAVLIIDTILVGGLGEGALTAMGIATSVLQRTNVTNESNNQTPLEI